MSFDTSNLPQALLFLILLPLPSSPSIFCCRSSRRPLLLCCFEVLVWERASYAHTNLQWAIKALGWLLTRHFAWMYRLRTFQPRCIWKKLRSFTQIPLLIYVQTGVSAILEVLVAYISSQIVSLPLSCIHSRSFDCQSSYIHFITVEPNVSGQIISLFIFSHLLSYSKDAEATRPLYKAVSNTLRKSSAQYYRHYLFVNCSLVDWISMQFARDFWTSFL